MLRALSCSWWKKRRASTKATIDELKGRYDTRRHTLSGVDGASRRPQRGAGPLEDVRDAGR